MSCDPHDNLVVDDAPPGRNLCRFRGNSCGGCCWGAKLDRDAVIRALRKQTNVIAEWPKEALPSRRELMLHELRCRRWLDLLWAPFLLLPLVGAVLGNWLHGRLVCAFLVFTDEDETTVGCALHPARWQGEDVRTATAFRWLSDFVCGARTFFCPGAEAFFSATDGECDELAARVESMDFYDYSNLAPGYSSAGQSPSYAFTSLASAW